MANASPNHASLHRLSPVEWARRREESIQRIGNLLAEQQLTVLQVAERLGLPRGTAYSHMAHMEKLALAHRTGERVNNQELWADGEKPEPIGQPVTPVPRVVVNVRRDELVEALFGPARAAA